MAEELERKLAQAGVFAGHRGLRGLLEAHDFWEQQAYGTRLYYGPGGGQYLHRSILAAAVAILDEPTEVWRPIETAPRDEECFFWVVHKDETEAFTDTDGRPIIASGDPYLHKGKYGSWSALSKATHWMRLPSPPQRMGDA